jgi:hypothetical protein
VTTSAVTADGQLAAVGDPRLQPFFVDLNLPVALTRNDQVSIPLVVYNYLDAKQTVELKINGDWFICPMLPGVNHDNELPTLELVARNSLTATAAAGTQVGLQNVAQRPAQRTLAMRSSDKLKSCPTAAIEEVVNGSLGPKAENTPLLPKRVIEGSLRRLWLYPTTFSQLSNH